MCKIIFLYYINFIIRCSHLQRSKVKCVVSLFRECNDCCGGQMPTLGELLLLVDVLPQPKGNML